MNDAYAKVIKLAWVLRLSSLVTPAMRERSACSERSECGKAPINGLRNRRTGSGGRVPKNERKSNLKVSLIDHVLFVRVLILWRQTLFCSTVISFHWSIRIWKLKIIQILTYPWRSSDYNQLGVSTFPKRAAFNAGCSCSFDIGALMKSKVGKKKKKRGNRFPLDSAVDR